MWQHCQDCSLQACKVIADCDWIVGIPLQSMPPQPFEHSQTAQFVCSVVFLARKYPSFMQRGSSLSILFLHTADKRRHSAPRDVCALRSLHKQALLLYRPSGSAGVNACTVTQHSSSRISDACAELVWRTRACMLTRQHSQVIRRRPTLAAPALSLT